MDTKSKAVAKKVKSVAAPLKESDQIMEKASKGKSLRDPTKIGHKFTADTLKFGEGFLTDMEKPKEAPAPLSHGLRRLRLAGSRASIDFRHIRSFSRNFTRIDPPSPVVERFPG